MTYEKNFPDCNYPDPLRGDVCGRVCHSHTSSADRYADTLPHTDTLPYGDYGCL